MTKQNFANNDLKTLSDKEIEAFKQKYGEIFHITLTGKDGSKKECFLHRPGRKELAHAHIESRNAKGDPYKYNEVLAKDCWLAGDQSILTDDYYFLGLSFKLDEIINFADAELEKK